MVWKAALIGIFAFVIALVAYAMMRPSQPIQPYGNAAQQQAESRSAENRPSESWRDAWIRAFRRDPINLFTFALVIATVFLGVVAVCTDRTARSAANAAQQSADAARDAVELAKRNAVRELRAYLSLEVFVRKWPPPPDTADRYGASWIVANNGRTLAKRATMSATFYDQDSSDTRDSWDLATWPKPDQIFTFPVGARPGFQYPDISFADAAAIRDGQFRRTYMAWITYEDVISDKPIIWRTEMSQIINFDARGDWSFSASSTHNCTDEDCPK